MRKRTTEEWLDLLLGIPLALFVFGSGLYFAGRALLRYLASL